MLFSVTVFLSVMSVRAWHNPKSMNSPNSNVYQYYLQEYSSLLDEDDEEGAEIVVESRDTLHLKEDHNFLAE